MGWPGRGYLQEEKVFQKKFLQGFLSRRGGCWRGGLSCRLDTSLVSPPTRALELAWEVHPCHQARKVRRPALFPSAASCVFREARTKQSEASPGLSQPQKSPLLPSRRQASSFSLTNHISLKGCVWRIIEKLLCRGRRTNLNLFYFIFAKFCQPR